MHDPATVRKLTTLFPLFLGLRLLPIGLWFLVVAIPLPGSPASPVQLALLAVAVAAVWWIHRWYGDTYGVVEVARRRFGRAWVLLGGVAAAYLVLALGAGRFDTRSLVIGLVLVVFATGAGWALPRFAGAVGPAIGIALVAGLGAALMVLVPDEPARLGEIGWLFSLALGMVLCAAGWAEHRSLVAALPAAPVDRGGQDPTGAADG